MPSADLDTRAVVTRRRGSRHQQWPVLHCRQTLYRHDSIAADFEKKFVARMKNLRVGDPFDEKKPNSARLPPADARQVARRRRSKNR